MATDASPAAASRDRGHYLGGFVIDEPRTTTALTKARDWIASRRPTEPHLGRPWFVILTAVFLGLALLTSTGIFIFGAILSGALAWWRRENARAGLAQVAIWAFGLGLVAVLFTILFYFIPGIPFH